MLQLKRRVFKSAVCCEDEGKTDKISKTACAKMCHRQINCPALFPICLVLSRMPEGGGRLYLQKRSLRGRSSGSHRSSSRGCCTQSPAKLCTEPARRTATTCRRRPSQSPCCAWKGDGCPGMSWMTSGCPRWWIWGSASCSWQNSRSAPHPRNPCRCRARYRASSRSVQLY